jgi:hypothetical protein
MNIAGRNDNAPTTSIWLTPPHIIAALGGADSFDLDPCAAPDPRPWATARRMNARADANGLLIEWDGRIFLNPPYEHLKRWLARMAEHDRGTSLIFAKTDTQAWHRFVAPVASGLFFIEGRVTFYLPDGSIPLRKDGSVNNAGQPSVLCAYGQDDLDRLMECGLAGQPVPLRFARFVLVAAIEQTWSQAMGDWLRRQRGPVSVADAYRFFAAHPKAKSNPNWQAKVRQKLRELADRVGPATYSVAA